MFVRMRPEDRTLKCSRGYDLSKKSECLMFAKELFRWLIANKRVWANGKMDTPFVQLEFSEEGWGAF